MSFLEKSKKVGKAIARGAATYLEYQSRSNSRSSNFTDEQRESFSEYADRMHEFKESLNDYDDD